LRNPNWTRNETLVAFYFHSKLLYNEVTETHPDVIRLSELLPERSVGSVKAKLGNIHSRSPVTIAKGHVGVSHASRLDEEIWEEYEVDPDGVISQAIDAMKSFGCEKGEFIVGSDALFEGEDIVVNAKRRLHQNIFRNEILKAYDGRCCVTGISDPNILNASHIKPWVNSNGKEKTSVSNGLCLNLLHDRLFDRGMITVDSRYRLIFSEKLQNALDRGMYDSFETFVGKDEQTLFLDNVPEKLRPDRKFLSYHNECIFLDNNI